MIVGLPSTAHAGHHLWRFSQLFSNASGSVQFMQLEDNEQGVSNVTITSGANTFTFPAAGLGNPQTSVHKWILIGTSNVGTLPGGVTPDYTIPGVFRLFPSPSQVRHDTHLRCDSNGSRRRKP